MHRIGIEQDKLAEAAQKQRTGWNWRALFQPRSPVFAAGLLALLALLGMGGLHVQHASLDPLGALWHLVHSQHTTNSIAPGQVVARAEWHPNGQGSGTLTIYAQTQLGTTAGISALNYSTGGQKHVLSQNNVAVSADHETTLTVPLEARPASDLTLTVSAPDAASASVPVTLMEPVSTP